MILLENIYKTFREKGVAQVVARNISAVFPAGVSIALLGRNGAGKSSLLRMIAGTMDADRGRVIRKGTVSWPVGYAGSFHNELTGAQNVRFVARIYGADSDALLHYVADFAELGAHFHLPLRAYSSGMRARLSFGLSMGLRFDTYLVDEVTAVGDAAFREKCDMVFAERLSGSGAIVVSHSRRQVLRLCRSGAVLEDGRLTFYPDIADAVAAHFSNMGVTPVAEDDS